MTNANTGQRRALYGRGASDKASQRQPCLHRNLEKRALSEAERSAVKQCVPGDKDSVLDPSLGRLL